MRDIMVYDEAHYFSNAENEINLGGVITELTESTNPIESEKHKQTFEGIFTVIKWIYTCFFSAFIGGLVDRYVFKKSNN